jgi:hypothetical protein
MGAQFNQNTICQFNYSSPLYTSVAFKALADSCRMTSACCTSALTAWPPRLEHNAGAIPADTSKLAAQTAAAAANGGSCRSPSKDLATSQRLQTNQQVEELYCVQPCMWGPPTLPTTGEIIPEMYRNGATITKFFTKALFQPFRGPSKYDFYKAAELLKLEKWSLCHGPHGRGVVYVQVLIHNRSNDGTALLTLSVETRESRRLTRPTPSSKVQKLGG